MTMLTKRQLARFLVVAFALAFVAQAIAVHAGVVGRAARGRPWLLLCMWAPALACLSSAAARALAWSSLQRSGWRSVGWGLLVGWTIPVLQTLLLWITGLGHWDQELFHLSTSHDTVERIHGIAMMLGVEHQSLPWFAFNLCVTITLASFVNALIGGLGEELGWRGVLQPELQRRFGALRGILLLGAIWAYWHLPANLAGYNDDVHPILGAIVIFPFAAICMSFGYAWLVQRRASVWPAAVAHGATNTMFSGLLLKPDGWRSDQMTAIAAALVSVLIYGYLLRRATLPAIEAGTVAVGARLP